jgi:hypothetical protein
MVQTILADLILFPTSYFAYAALETIVIRTTQAAWPFTILMSVPAILVSMEHAPTSTMDTHAPARPILLA